MNYSAAHFHQFSHRPRLRLKDRAFGVASAGLFHGLTVSIGSRATH
jgi:hypothetical protein